MRNRPPLSKIQIVILTLHGVLAVVFAVVGFVGSGSADGWADLARIATAVLAVIYVVAIGTVAAVERYAISNEAVRTVLSVLGPPAMIAVAIFAIQNI